MPACRQPPLDNPCEPTYFVLQSIEGPRVTEFDKALAEISAIRSQMARAADFRGYGPATFATTGLLAMLAAAAQALWIDPATQLDAYLALWMATAAVSVAIIGYEMVGRSRRIHSALADEMIGSAVRQFLPAAVTGGLISVVVLRFAAASAWMLPGLWQVVFGLGVFASCRFLPKAMVLVGGWYLACGLGCIAFAGGAHAFSPLAMGVPFGVGQLMIAAVLRYGAGGRDDEA